jgi:serine/threonine protein kinase
MGVGTPSSTVPAHARAFGKYTLLAKLATGGMAEIFLARMKGVAGFEKQVVIKKILPQYADDEQFVAMFLDEARIAARINHPNVCQVYELGEVDNQYFLAMEYLEGVPLTTVLRRITKDGRMPDLRLVSALVVQACEGLHNAHELKDLDGQPIGVVHRDVSPQNLFVTVDGTVKVLDFGIAKAQGASAKTRTGTVKGKYAYMSPEQLRGEALDRRSDVFALGVVLFESVTGRRLFHRETDYLIFKAITDEPIPSVRELRQDLPPALAMTIHKALSRNRDERTATARQLGQGVAKSMEPYGGLLSQLAIAELIESTFAEDIAKAREKITAALNESNKLDSEEVPRVDLGSNVGGQVPKRRPPSRSPDAAPADMRMDTPEQLTDRNIDPAAFVAAPPEEPDESATDVWDGMSRPPWESGNVDEMPTATASIEVLDALLAHSRIDNPSADRVAAAAEADVENAVTPVPMSMPLVPPPPPLAATIPMSMPLGSAPAAPRVQTGPTPAFNPPVQTYNPAQAYTPSGGTSFEMEELRPRRRVGLWLAGVLVGLVAAGAYLLITQTGEDPEMGGVTSIEATNNVAPPIDPPPAVEAPVKREPIKPAASVKPEPVKPEPVKPEPKPEATPPKPEAAPPRPAEVRRAVVPPPVAVKRVVRDDPDEEDSAKESPADKDPPREEKRREEKAPALEPGFFTVDANPYATIYIDGKNVGPTPVIKVTLSAGRHTVRAVPQSGKAKIITITVEPGRLATHKFTW